VILEKCLQAPEGVHNVKLGGLSSLGDLSDLDPLVDLVLREGVFSAAGAKSGVAAYALLADDLLGRLGGSASGGLGVRDFFKGGLLLILDLVFAFKLLLAVVAVDAVGLAAGNFLQAGFDEGDKFLGLLPEMGELVVKLLHANVIPEVKHAGRDDTPFLVELGQIREEINKAKGLLPAGFWVEVLVDVEVYQGILQHALHGDARRLLEPLWGVTLLLSLLTFDHTN
jgi:hypothetical protein